MIGAVIALLLTVPTFVRAEGLPRQEYSFLSSFVQMIAALSIVIGLILVTKYFSGKLIRRNIADRFNSRHIRLVEIRAISPKKALILVEVGGEYLLLASTENRLDLLKQVEVFEEIEVLDEEADVRPGLFSLFHGKVEKWRH